MPRPSNQGVHRQGRHDEAAVHAYDLWLGGMTLRRSGGKRTVTARSPVIVCSVLSPYSVVRLRTSGTGSATNTSRI